MLGDNTREVLEKIGKYYVAELRTQLRLNKNVATRRLYDSIKYEVIGDNVLALSAEEYIKALSEGKRIAKSENPSRLQTYSTLQWMRAKGVQPRNSKGQFKKKTNANMKSAAFAIARSINRRAWKGSDIIQKAYKRIEKDVDKDMVNAFKAYIDKEFDKIIIK